MAKPDSVLQIRGRVSVSYCWHDSLPVYLSSDTWVKKGLNPVAENEGAGGCRSQPRQGGHFCCSDSNRYTNDRQAPKARRLKVQELATVPTPTRSLPNRPGRNVHPAGVPKVRRSKEQIEAEREAANKVIEEKTQKVRMAKERLAQMNLLEEYDNDLPLQHPPRLSAMIQKRRHMDVETDSDEHFDLREADHHGSDSDLDFDSDSVPKHLDAAKPKTKVRSMRCLGWVTIHASIIRVNGMSRVQLIRSL